MPNVDEIRKKSGVSEQLISYVKDRQDMILRYAIAIKSTKGMGWSPSVTFEQGWKNVLFRKRDWLKILRAENNTTYYE
jgi:dTDP-D-glucose 4,6-dehydratase